MGSPKVGGGALMFGQNKYASPGGLPSCPVVPFLLLFGKGCPLKSTHQKRTPLFSHGHWASEVGRISRLFFSGDPFLGFAPSRSVRSCRCQLFTTNQVQWEFKEDNRALAQRQTSLMEVTGLRRGGEVPWCRSKHTEVTEVTESQKSGFPSFSGNLICGKA